MPSGFFGTASFGQVKISLANPQVVWAGSHMVEDHPMLGDSPLFVSTDGGLTFEATTIYPDVPLGAVTGVETHPTDENTAYALFSFANAPKILRTRDLGQTWEDISGFGTGSTSTNGFPNVAVFSLLVMPYDTDIIWAGTEIGLFESTDGGATWHAADNGFPHVAVFEMVIVNDQVVVATHGRGVWSVSLPQLQGYEPPPATRAVRLNSVSSGTAGIISVNASLRSPYDSTQVVVDGQPVFKLGATATVVDTSFSFPIAVQGQTAVSVAMQGFQDSRPHRSFAKSVIVGQPVSVEENEEQLPERFGLSQNYPNPFNPTTNINYELPQTAAVNLIIYNMRGEVVRRLVQNQHQSAGRYTVQWDGADENGHSVPTGVYFYRIQAGDFVKAFKMTLIK